MAEKRVFFCNAESLVEEKMIPYEYSRGFAIVQKQKNIDSLHRAINEKYPEKNVLEISTKSPESLGLRLSAFNLPFYHKKLQQEFSVENIFQSSKVFENGGPYEDLLHVPPGKAKRDSRLQESGALLAFNLYEEKWPLEPKTLFYDWIYVCALKGNMGLTKKLCEYDVFTDIEFNHKKSINCQARIAAIFVSLHRIGKLEEKTKDVNSFKTIYDEIVGQSGTQLSMHFGVL